MIHQRILGAPTPLKFVYCFCVLSSLLYFLITHTTKVICDRMPCIMQPCFSPPLSDAHPSPSQNAAETIMFYPDGAQISYNHASSILKASAIQSATVQAAKQVTIDCPETTVNVNVTINGALNLKGLLSYQSGMVGRSASGSSTGAVTGIHGLIIQQGGQLVFNGDHA